MLNECICLMDKETFEKKMREAVYNPRLDALFVELKMSVGHTDRHYYEVFCGFQCLKQFVADGNQESLEKAIRKFDYVLDEDLKYVRAISYYGKGIAYAYLEKFYSSFSYLDTLMHMTVTFATDRSEFVEELQTEARHLKGDIKAWDKELNPFLSFFR